MTNIPKAWKSFWTCPIELDDVALVESHFGIFRDGVCVRAI
jgi:hypothetical protein